MRRERRIAGVLAAVALGVALAGGQGTHALFSGQASNAGSSLAAATDLTAPSASAAVVGKASGGATGYIKQGASYHVYASVADSGSPASGIASVTADVSSFDAGETAVPLVAGSYSAGGVGYTHRSAALSANATLAAGAYALTLKMTDAATNARTQGGFSVTVDNTAPQGADVQTADGNGDPGEPGAGDRVVFTFSEPVEPASILAGWTGSATSVTVRIRDGGVILGLLGDDELDVRNAANSASLPFGVTNLKAGGYASGLAGGYAVWSSSQMVMSGSQVTITLGTHSGLSTGEGGCCPTMQWPTVTGPLDRADNGLLTGTVTEGGTADEDF